MSARKLMVLGAFVLAACGEAAVTAEPEGPTAPPSDTPFRLGTFAMNGRDFVGVVLNENRVIDLAAADAALGIEGDPPGDMKDLIARYDTGVREMIRLAIGAVEAAEAAPAYAHALEAVTIRPPIMYPMTMLNTAVNYAEHDIEMARVRDGSPGQDAPTAGGALPDTTSATGYWDRAEGDWRWNPFMFIKATSAIIAHGEPIVIPPMRDQIEWECELGVVIAGEASRVPVESAEDYIFGYTLQNDVSDRGGRGDARYGSDWLISKSHDTFAPLGPFITPKEFVPNVQDLPISFALNGEVLQEGTTRQMIHSVAEQVHYATNVITLRTGDIIATGTVPGAGSAREPPIFFKPGDIATCTYGGIGTLVNPVEAAE